MFRLFRKKCYRCKNKSRDTIKIEIKIREQNIGFNKIGGWKQDYYTTIDVCPKCVIHEDTKI